MLASKSSEGKEITIANNSYIVESLDGFNFNDTDIALFSAGGNISEKYAIEATKKYNSNR